MNEFDDKAAEWDNNPMHWERSKAIAELIAKRIPLTKDMTALEYGAGTGITSFILKDFLKNITLMDNLAEMVKVMNAKIDAANTKNLYALKFDLEQNDYEGKSVDLVFMQMVLHHVNDIDSIISKFSKMLNPGGFIAIADLYQEDGSFHGEGFNGHKGFNPKELSDTLTRNSFTGISHTQCFTIPKIISSGETRNFEVFLLTGRLK